MESALTGVSAFRVLQGVGIVVGLTTYQMSLANLNEAAYVTGWAVGCMTLGGLLETVTSPFRH